MSMLFSVYVVNITLGARVCVPAYNICRWRLPFGQWQHNFHLKAVLPLAQKASVGVSKAGPNLFQVKCPQITKTIGSTSIRHRSDTSASDRYLIDVESRVCVIWIVSLAWEYPIVEGMTNGALLPQWFSIQKRRNFHFEAPPGSNTYLTMQFCTIVRETPNIALIRPVLVTQCRKAIKNILSLFASLFVVIKQTLIHIVHIDNIVSVTVYYTVFLINKDTHTNYIYNGVGWGRRGVYRQYFRYHNAW